MNLGLNDRIALVTGGSKGIGAAIVRELAREGARVICSARPSPELDRLVSEITSAGGQCFAVPADLQDPTAIPPLVSAAAAHWHGLDILVNNAGGAPRFGGFEDLDDDDWLRSFNFNVMSVVRVTRAALPHLRRSSLRRIINISSLSALQPGAYNPHYTTTKAAVVNLSKHLATTLAPEGILVNTICPGPVHSDSWDTHVGRYAREHQLTEDAARREIERQEAAKIPLGSIGEGHHVAAAVAFLASPVSNWTTGACFHLNGGKLGAAV
jgi:NAD(P)-dependent dehydrogenase (short-subunit alcohol dehydrogenase family)